MVWRLAMSRDYPLRYGQVSRFCLFGIWLGGNSVMSDMENSIAMILGWLHVLVAVAVTFAAMLRPRFLTYWSVRFSLASALLSLITGMVLIQQVPVFVQLGLLSLHIPVHSLIFNRLLAQRQIRLMPLGLLLPVVMVLVGDNLRDHVLVTLAVLALAGLPGAQCWRLLHLGGEGLTRARIATMSGFIASWLAVLLLVLDMPTAGLVIAILASPLALYGALYGDHMRQHGPHDMLQRLDRRLKFLSRITSDAVFLHKDGMVLDANLAARQLFGLGGDEVLGRRIESFIDPLYHDEFHRQLTVEEPDEDASLVAIDGEGNERAVHLYRPAMEERGESGDEGALLVFKDMGERLAAQQSIVDQTALLLLTLEDNSHAVALFKADGTARFMNRLFRVWSGLPVGQYQGELTLTGLVTWLISEGEHAPFGADLVKLAGEDQMAVFRVMSPPDPLLCQQMADLVVTWLLAEGGRRGEWETRHGHVYRFGMQQLPDSGLLLNLFDITEIRRQASQLHQQSLVMHQQERMARLGSLLTGVSHELNNPLTIVIGQASMLRDMAKDDKTRNRAVQIYDAAQRCRKIVTGFLDIARRNVPEEESADLHDLVHAVLAIMQPRLKMSDIRVELMFGEEEARVDIDADQVQQVIMNLVINAMHALENHTGLRRIRIGSRISVLDGICSLWVEDTGPGVPENLREKIFEAFFTTKTAEEGTGIGLSLCRDILNAHHGQLLLDPATPAGGARFTISLPLPVATQKNDALGTE